MKILMIPSWYPTDASPLLGTFYREQAEALVARGHEVAVLYADVDGRFRRDHHGIRQQVSSGGVLELTWQKLNLTPRWEAGRCAQRKRMLRAMYRRLVSIWGRPDVVNLRASLQGYEAVDLCKREGLPLFFMEHSSFVVSEGEDSAARRRLYAVMDAAQVCAAVGSTLMKVMQPHGETRFIPDFVDGERFFIKPEPQPFDWETPAHKTAFVFRAMGQLRPIKDHATLIAAFATLTAMTDRPVLLDIAGAGPLRETLQQQIDEADLSDRCRLVGLIPRERGVDFMNGADVFICSSRMEMLSCVLHECAACGVPALATACGGPGDIITPETGRLVPVGDAEAMAKAMLDMMDAAPEYDRIRIRESILERFGMDEVCRLLTNACEDAVALHSKGNTP